MRKEPFRTILICMQTQRPNVIQEHNHHKETIFYGAFCCSAMLSVGISPSHAISVSLSLLALVLSSFSFSLLLFLCVFVCVISCAIEAARAFVLVLFGLAVHFYLLYMYEPHTVRIIQPINKTVHNATNSRRLLLFVIQR